MTFRESLFRNLRILGLISICFTVGVFAAEFVGNLLQPPTQPGAQHGVSAAPDTQPAPAPSTQNADGTSAADVATLPDAATQVP